MKSPRRNVLNIQKKQQTKSISQFSSLDKFDFPTTSNKNIYTNKSPTKIEKFTNQKRQKQQQLTQRKTKYYNHIRQEHQNQRYKAKQLQKKIDQQRQNQKKQQILQQLKKKKTMLQKLQQQRQQLIKKHGQAEEHAKLMNTKIQMKRLKSQENKKHQQKKQSQRYNIALERVKSDKELHNEYFRQKSQSIKRYEVNNLYKCKQRIEAQKYQTVIQAREEQKRRLKQQQQKQKKMKMLDRFKSGKSVDYDKTCFHSVEKNFIVLKEDLSNAKTAHTLLTRQSQTQTQEYARLCQQRKTQKKLKQEQDRQKSAQRGRQALKKLKQAKQCNQYIEQTQQKQLMYNLQRIQKGKKNQYVGIKPQTMRTYVKNKQSRAQEEFENMFMTPTKNRQNNMQRTMKSFGNETKDKTNCYRKFNNQTSKNEDQLSQQQDQSPRNIFTIPFNTKIHAIMLEKSRPTYHKQLFIQQQQQKNRQNYVKVDKKIGKQKFIDKNREDKNKFHYDQQLMTLDYSVTDMQDAGYC